MRTSRPSPTPGETLPLSVLSVMRWLVLALVIFSICVVYVACPLLGAFFNNLGRLNLIHGLTSETIPNSSFWSAQRWFALAARTDEWQGTRPSGSSYGSELAYLATLDLLTDSYHPDLENWFHSKRGQLLQQAAIPLALRRADEARRKGQAAEEKAWRIFAVELQPEKAYPRRQLAVWLVSEHGDIAEAISQYEMAIGIEEPTWQDYLRLVALNLKAGRSEQATYWYDKLRQLFPDANRAGQLGMQGSWAQVHIADAYAYFGWLDDAIAIGERSLAIDNWGWGHRVVARFYQLQGRYPEAERHLLAAVELSTSGAYLLEYRVALGELYAEQGKTQQAVTQYCRVLHDSPAVDASGSPEYWRARAVSGLTELIEVPKSEVSSLCDSR